MSDKPSFKDLVLRAVAVVGLVAVLLVGAWGIIQIAFYIPTLFGQSDTTTSTDSAVSTSTAAVQTPTATEALSLVTPTMIASGQPFLFSWNHQNETGAYAYQISYWCGSGVSLKAIMPTGKYKAVACNTPFNFVSATSSMPVELAVVGKKQSDVVLMVAAQRLLDGAITSVASSTVTVLPTASASKQTPIQPTATTNRTNLYGLADFETQIISVTPSYLVAGQTHYTAEFVVRNVGTNATPANWEFSALIPVNGGYTYYSPVQQKLYPGDKIVYTLGFDVLNTNYNSYNSYTGTFTVTADPQNIANESNKINNTATISVQL